MKNRVVVGLSGGVDSGVAAYLLKKQGFEVLGVFMKNWDDKDDPHCPAAEDAFDARRIADILDIKFYTFNFSKEYWDNVFEYFLEAHKKYQTPNPDILCNRYIKFGVFADYAKKMNAQFMATGHYAKKILNPETKKFELHTPKDKDKDQTYFLYPITQEALGNTLFPLENYNKSEVRAIAKKNNFPNAEKKDSTGICFVGERNYMDFLQKYLKKNPGDIITPEGKIIGEHIGLTFYTIGQRKNLQIGGVSNHPEAPWFVLEKNIEKNQLVVCQNDNNPLLFKKTLKTQNIHWITDPPSIDSSLSAKIRYRQEFQDCKITNQEKNTLSVEFTTPQRAVTQGQSIVFYDQEKTQCLGGGEIV